MRDNIRAMLRRWRHAMPPTMFHAEQNISKSLPRARYDVDREYVAGGKQ